MAYERGELSKQFDPQAHAAISRAIRQYERKQKNSRVPGWVEIQVPNTPLDAHVHNKQRLSFMELEFQRALYQDDRIYTLTGGRKKPNPRWSLKPAWDPVPLLPGSPRTLRIQVFPKSSGRRHVENGPRSQSWAENPDLRSAGGIQATG